MPKKILYFLVVVILFLITTIQDRFYGSSILDRYLISISPRVLAQEPPTPTLPPTCDLCGWCNPQTNPKPPNWESCNACLYQPDGTPREYTYYTAIGCISTKSDLFVKSLLSIVFGIGGGVAFLVVIGGTITVLTSAADPEKLQKGKEMITSSLAGILLILFSVFLLRTVGFDILRIPGFG